MAPWQMERTNNHVTPVFQSLSHTHITAYPYKDQEPNLANACVCGPACPKDPCGSSGVHPQPPRPIRGLLLTMAFFATQVGVANHGSCGYLPQEMESLGAVYSHLSTWPCCATPPQSLKYGKRVCPTLCKESRGRWHLFLAGTVLTCANSRFVCGPSCHLVYPSIMGFHPSQESVLRALVLFKGNNTVQQGDYDSPARRPIRWLDRLLSGGGRFDLHSE